MSSGDDRALLGRTIAGKFLVESFIGGGAMGKVYRARHLALEKTVAVKVMHRELSTDGTFAARFHREAKAASRLDHPNSIRVLDFGEEPDGLLYLAMEFVDGRDLFTVIQNEWPLPNERIVNVLTQALAAMAVAHDMGVVHRDLKPENILVLHGKDDEEREVDIVKVCDFGIAKIIDARGDEESKGKAGAKLTTQGLVVGTPEYMSPEQGRGESLDARSDLYSAGVILYQMLTGRVPFEAESAIGVVLKHVTDEPIPPSQIRSSVDPRLEAVCLKAMRKRREDRYQTAREMRADMRGLALPDPHAPMSRGSLGRAKTEQMVGGVATTSSAPAPALTPVPMGGAPAHTPTISSSPAPAHSHAEMGVAETVSTLDSGQVQQALAASRSTPQRTQSNVTPVATETLSGPPARGSRGALIGMLVVAMAAGVGITLYATRPKPPPPALASTNATLETAHANVEGSANASATATANANISPPSASIVATLDEPKPAPHKPNARHEAPAKATAPPPVAAPAPEAPAPVTTPAPPAATSAPPAPPAPSPAPIAAPAPAPTPVAPVSAPAKPFAPDRATVAIRAIETTQGLPSSRVRMGLQRVHPAMTHCYRTALLANGAPAGGETSLFIALDDTGRVTSASLGGSTFLPAVRACIESSVRNVSIKDVDTGEATAVVHLEFRPE